MPQTNDPPVTPLKAASLALELYGPQETEEALIAAGMAPDEVRSVMRRLKPTNN